MPPEYAPSGADFNTKATQIARAWFQRNPHLIPNRPAGEREILEQYQRYAPDSVRDAVNAAREADRHGEGINWEELADDLTGG